MSTWGFQTEASPLWESLRSLGFRVIAVRNSCWVLYARKTPHDRVATMETADKLLTNRPSKLGPLVPKYSGPRKGTMISRRAHLTTQETRGWSSQTTHVIGIFSTNGQSKGEEHKKKIN